MTVEIMSQEPTDHFPTPASEKLRREMMESISSLYTK